MLTEISNCANLACRQSGRLIAQFSRKAQHGVP
jgi:hypothetical protein